MAILSSMTASRWSSLRAASGPALVCAAAACSTGTGSDGPCGPTCGGTCSNGRCEVVLASQQENPVAIALNATDVYWMNLGDTAGVGAVMRVPVVGGSPETIAPAPDPVSMALDATTVYWASEFEGIVSKAPLGGGVAATVVARQTMGAIHSIAVDEASVYWTSGNGVAKALLAGGSSQTLESDDGAPMDIAVDDTNVYWTNGFLGTVMTAPKGGGGAATTVARAQSYPWWIAIDETNVYWANWDDGTVMRVAKSGGAVTTLASGQSLLSSLAIDDASVYWASPDGVMKVSKQGGAITTLSSDKDSLGVAVDATSVYWVDATSVRKVTPK